MRKAIMKNLTNTEEKVAASEFEIEVYHRRGNVVRLENTSYTYEDVFEFIKDKYADDLDYIQKITINVKG